MPSLSPISAFARAAELVHLVAAALHVEQIYHLPSPYGEAIDYLAIIPLTFVIWRSLPWVLRQLGGLLYLGGDAFNGLATAQGRIDHGLGKVRFKIADGLENFIRYLRRDDLE
jgi:hypothetical protein